MTPSPENTARYRDLNDDALLAECRWDTFRGSGPGGQKRNKTSSMVRLTHLPTSISVIAGESRSQVENKARAVRRLKMRLATDLRRAIDLHGWEPPVWIDQLRARPLKDAPLRVGLRLQISHRHPLYYHLAGLTLDLLEARRGHIADVAGLFGFSTSSLTRFLAGDPHLLTAANRIRSQGGQPPLNIRK